MRLATYLASDIEEYKITQVRFKIMGQRCPLELWMIVCLDLRCKIQSKINVNTFHFKMKRKVVVFLVIYYISEVDADAESEARTLFKYMFQSFNYISLKVI